MRKIVIHCETNIVGTDSWEFVEVEDNTTDLEINDMAQALANDNAESYGIYPPSEEDDEEDAEEADDNISGTWYDYVPEKHDMYTTNRVPS